MKRLCRLFLLLFTLLLTVGAPFAARAAEAVDEAAVKQEEGIPLKSPVIGHVGGLPISSSMVVTWIVAIGIIIFAQIATRNIKEVPEGAQNFWEWMVEGLWNLLEGIIGHDLLKKTFWFFASLFIVIVFSNWIGLLPFFGTVGWGHASGPFISLDHLDRPLFRGANADFNMTFAMAMLFFVMWIFWAFQANGVGGFILHLFGPKGDTKGLLKVLMVIIFIAVGFLEVFSILFRPISLSFRLYGNIFAGENMMDAMGHLVKSGPAWLKTVCSIVIPIPFYFMELLTGIVQAMVFMLLTAVFTLLICQHSDGGHGEHHH